MSSELHEKIMNLPCERTMSHFVTKSDLLHYKEGHREARHAAAELAIGYEAAPSVASVAPELPEPFDMDMPELHIVGLSCGVEDRSIHDRYEAAEYGWRECYDAFVQVIPVVYTADQMRAYGQACAAAEREQAAKLCEDGLIDSPTIYETAAMQKCADAIRARK